MVLLLLWIKCSVLFACWKMEYGIKIRRNKNIQIKKKCTNARGKNEAEKWNKRAEKSPQPYTDWHNDNRTRNDRADNENILWPMNAMSDDE